MAEGQQLVRHRLADAARTVLVEIPSGVPSAAVSPDSRHVAFITANARGDGVLYLAPIGDQPSPERDWCRIAEDRRGLINPCWSPDGNLLYHVSARDGNYCLWAQRIDRNGKPRGELFAAFHSHLQPSLYFTGGVYGVTRDRLLLGLGSVKGNIWTTELGKEGRE